MNDVFKLSLLIMLFNLSVVYAAEVRSVEWGTANASAPAKVMVNGRDVTGTIRYAVSHSPEPLVMQLSGLGGEMLGLKKQQNRQLQRLTSSYYKKMSLEIKEGEFPAVPSALSYCYSDKKPSKGFANVYLPSGFHKNSSVVVFLHGYGGSFSFYMHYMAKVFPEHIIVCPAYGISMSRVNDRYIAECKLAVEKEIGHKLTKPLLVGLSAGGTGGFRHYQRQMADYRKFICMVSLPPRDVVKVMPKNAKVALIAGGEEGFVKSGLLARRVRQMNLKHYEQVIVKGHGHFLMLSDQEQTMQTLRELARK